MKKVYVLEHSYEDDTHEDSKLIGVYSNIDNANVAINRLKTQPGFRDYPDGFNIDEHQIDHDNWVEGFGA